MPTKFIRQKIPAHRTSRQKYSGETLVATHTFAYGADGWEDRLTGYNNQAIEYDNIGNPTTYLGARIIQRQFTILNASLC